MDLARLARREADRRQASSASGFDAAIEEFHEQAAFLGLAAASALAGKNAEAKSALAEAYQLRSPRQRSAMSASRARVLAAIFRLIAELRPPPVTSTA